MLRRQDGPALLVSPFTLSEAMRAVMPALWAFDSRDWLSDLRLPTLVLAGGADPIVPVAHARSLQQAVPRATLTVIDGAGHVPVTSARSQVAEAVRRFIHGVLVPER